MINKEFETGEGALIIAQKYRERIAKLDLTIIAIQSDRTKGIQIESNTLSICTIEYCGPFKPVDMSEVDIGKEFKDAIVEVLTKRKAKLEEAYFKL